MKQRFIEQFKGVVSYIQLEGIPIIYWSGYEGDFQVCVINILGPSLEQLLQYCGRRFTIKTVIMIGQQILNRLQYIHSKGLVYRDIKPQNFLVGLGKQADKIYIIDFENSSRYRSEDGHIGYCKTNKSYGLDKFKSIYAHMNIQLSRRDDLQSLGYMLIYLLKGYLPWEQLEYLDDKERNLRMREKKIQIPLQLLCNQLPKQFVQYFQYVRELEFQEEPDYRWLKRIFKDLFQRENWHWDLIFDWALIDESPQASDHRDKRKSGTTFSNDSQWQHVIKK